MKVKIDSEDLVTLQDCHYPYLEFTAEQIDQVKVFRDDLYNVHVQLDSQRFEFTYVIGRTEEEAIDKVQRMFEAVKAIADSIYETGLEITYPIWTIELNCSYTHNGGIDPEKADKIVKNTLQLDK